MEGDIGAFDFGSRLGLDGQVYLGHRSKIFGQNSLIRAGDRALYQDYQSNDFH